MEIANAMYFKDNIFGNVFWKAQSVNPFEIVLLYAKKRGAFIT